MSNIPIWFLDVDGVVNALSRETQPGFQESFATCKGAEFLIRHHPSLVRFVNDVSRMGLAEVQWLTTWEDDAVTSLSPKLGLDPFHAWTDDRRTHEFGWWKLDRVIAVWEEERRPFIWTDDDLTDSHRATLADLPGLLINPDPLTGLTGHDFTRIGEFVSRAEMARGA